MRNRNQLVKSLAASVFAMLILTLGQVGHAAQAARTPTLDEILAAVRNADAKGARDAASEQARKQLAAIRNGAPVVGAGSVPGLRESLQANRARFQPLQEVVKAGLTRRPSDVSGSLLQQGKMLGAWRQGDLGPNIWTSLGRVFEVPKFDLIILQETDMTKGMSVGLPPELLNVRVRDQPGRLLILSDPTSGKSMMTLSWVDKAQVFFELYVEKTDAAAKQALLGIAEAIKP